MAEHKYQLRILPMFERDLNEIVDYISFRLQSPHAANTLVDEVEKAIYQRLDFAESFEKYHSKRERKHDYYKIKVKNYIIFYVVIGDVMEVRRILYNKRNIENIL